MGVPYSQVQSDFLLRLNRRDCTTALADSFIQTAIQRIQRKLRIPAMERSLQITIGPSTYTSTVPNPPAFPQYGALLLPNDLIKVRDIWRIASDGIRTLLTRKPLRYVLPLADSNFAGRSLFYAREGPYLVFAPTPLTGDIFQIDYWAEFPSDIQATDDIVINDTAEDLLLFGALSYACDHWSDKRGDRFEQRYQQILEDLQGQADEDELADAAVEQSFHYPPDDTDDYWSW